MTIKDAVIKYRNAHRISQRGLAQKLGIANTTVSRIESGAQIALSKYILQKLTAIITEEDLKDMDDADGEVAFLRREIAQKRNFADMHTQNQTKTHINLQRMQKISLALCDAIEACARAGYPAEDKCVTRIREALDDINALESEIVRDLCRTCPSQPTLD